jgi:hypothetical protein
MPMEKPLFGEPIFLGNFSGSRRAKLLRSSFYLLLGQHFDGTRNDYIHRHDKPGKWLTGVLSITRFDINKMPIPITGKQLHDMEVNPFGIIVADYKEGDYSYLIDEMNNYHNEYKKAFDVAQKYLILI